MAVESFSVKKKDEQLVNDIRAKAEANGVVFSHWIVEALKMFKEQELDRREDLR